MADPLGTGVTLTDRMNVRAVDLIGKGILTGVPELNRAHEWVVPDPPGRQEPQIQFTDARSTAEGHLFMRLRHGLYGDYDIAIGDGGEIDLRNSAAVREYRALMLTPANGEQGRLVVEAIDRRCPVTMLVRWLGYADFQADQNRWVQLKVKQVADRDRVRAMIKNAQEVTAELTQVQAGAPGGRRVDRRLTTSVTSELARDKAISEALSWLTPDENRNARDYVLRIETIAGFKPDELDEVGLHFNSGALVVTDEEKKEKRLDPESIRDKFTYEMSKNLPLEDEAWIRKVRDLLRGTLSEGTDIQI